ncbi:penicillin acylase family protein [Acetobacter orientalis]|uniref:penicillin acylase family protein n=1 Tax=Acetobacter orientalis TaxID=146474 RepID=UPI0039EC9AFA
MPISGDRELEGTLNITGFGNLTDHEYHNQSINQSIVGTSYFQVMTWNAEKLHSSGILACGQSSEPHAAYHSNQIKLFSRGKLLNLSFKRSGKSSSMTAEHGHV